MAVAAGANIGDEVLKLTDNVPGVPDISDATDLKGAANTVGFTICPVCTTMYNMRTTVTALANKIISGK